MGLAAGGVGGVLDYASAKLGGGGTVMSSVEHDEEATVVSTLLSIGAPFGLDRRSGANGDRAKSN